MGFWQRALVDAEGRPIRLKLTEGQAHDGRSTADMLDTVAFGPDGSLYVTNTAGPEVFRLKPGANEIEVFLKDDAIKAAWTRSRLARTGPLR